MEAIILLAHGSVLCGSGEALWEHAARLNFTQQYEMVEVGYLNYSDPPFLQSVERCILEGATRIIVCPYFVLPGKFVKVDVPLAIQTARSAYPDVDLVVADVIGADTRLADAILESASNARSADHWYDELAKASGHCRADSQCPLYGTLSCPRVPSPPEETEVTGVTSN